MDATLDANVPAALPVLPRAKMTIKELRRGLSGPTIITPSVESAIYVLLGEIELVMDGSTSRLARGEWKYLPAGRAHAIVPAGAGPARYFTVSLADGDDRWAA